MKVALKLIGSLLTFLALGAAVLSIPSYASAPVSSPTVQIFVPIAFKSFGELPQTTGLIINHQHVAAFSQIPDSAITNAAALRMMFRHASVGGNISQGLNALFAQNSKYNRSNWSFQNRGNPGWQEKVDDLVRESASQSNTKDILSMKLCYIDQDASWTYYRDHMEQLMAAYPTKRFVWWTIPIMTTGNASRDAFNTSLRSYAQTHDVVLFDLAAIESHDPAGNPITSNGHEAMYSDYSSDGGHLSATGQQRVAQAFWYMMARLTGWS